MKYFEMQHPYYALIVAKDEEKAKELYEEMVSDIDDKEEFYSNMKEVSKDYAKELFLNAVDEDGNLSSEEEFESMKNDLLLMDSSLF